MKRLALVLLLATRVFAQTTEYADDFQSYGTQANPAGWVDTAVGNPKPQADGLYKTWPDPLAPANIVYGTRQSSGKPEGNNPRIGTFSTLTTKVFSVEGRFEYRGRFYRDDAETRVGFKFLASYPDFDSYYLIGLWSNALTMQLFAFGAATPSGTTNSNFTPAVARWYRFAIVVDEAAGATRIRARFWPDGTAEPATFSIDALDSSAARLRTGRLGIWSAVKGSTYFDDLSARSPVDHAAPSIAFFENATPLAANTIFNRDARVDVRATDDVSGVASLTVTLDGQPYVPLTSISTDGRHAIHAHAVDNAGNAADADVAFTIDKTAPQVAVSIADGLVTSADVTPVITVQDSTAFTVNATLDGVAFTSGTRITSEGPHVLAVSATDAAGWTTTLAPIHFAIDRTVPALAFTSHTEGQRLSTARISVSGTAGDAVRVTVNGREATLSGGTFTSAPIDLVESTNAIAATAFDTAGNRADATLHVVLDTRAPDLTITSPQTDACTALSEIAVRGTVVDTNAGVKVNGVAATIDGINWSATVPIPSEGKVTLTIVATDDLGHASTLALPLRVDRTKPVITVSAIATPVNRAVTPDVRTDDGVLTITLDGSPYDFGTPIEGEGSHTLRATATDCAGNEAEPVTRTFTIDRTAPSIVSLAPANGAHVGSKPQLTGTLSEPATVALEASDVVAAVSGTSFTIALPLGEGHNEFALLVTDGAGNEARVPYTLDVTTTAPVVEIVENGLPLAPSYTRAVTLLIRVSDGAARVTATLNGNPFVSGTTIANDGAYTLVATAADAFDHLSNEARATFTIDRTPPHVTITAPAADAIVKSDSVEVRGTVDDAARVSVNGTAATLTGTSFAATVPLDEGTNAIVVTATDAAGNTGSARVGVTRDTARPALFLTSPPDALLTNRPTVAVAGQVLTTPATVRVNGNDVALDPAGRFRIAAFALVEGTNTITAHAAGAAGATNEVTIHVTADFTSPELRVTANGAALADGARYAAAPLLAVETEDGATTRVTIDGAAIEGGIPPLGDGAHALTAIARDIAGNETRVDRIFFIGDAATSGGCALSDVTPADGAFVIGDVVHISGRSGGADAVLINGIAAQVADGSFCGEAALAPGRNEIAIQCANAGGQPTSDSPLTLVVWRDAAPSIAITSPAEGAALTTGTITVSGTVSEGVTEGDVNGIPFTANGTAFSVPGVALAPGLNIITARAKSGAGQLAIATTRVRLSGAAPQLTITSPLTGTRTGASSIDVSGTYVNADPSSIRVNGATAMTSALTNTSGTFRATVALSAGAMNTITASAGSASASVDVQHVAGAPSLAIGSPLDDSTTAQASVHVTGTFNAAPGAQVLVNGVLASISGNAFAADVELPTIGVSPIVARLTTPDGDTTSDAVRITRVIALAIKETYPAANATNVDRGAAVVVLFNNSIDDTTSIRLKDASGNDVAGTLFSDRDAVTFAPSAPLRGGETYAATAAGQSFSFTTIAGAPSTAPSIDDLPTDGCFSAVTLTGRATANARVRLEADGVTQTTTASATGAFRFTFSFSGQTGFHMVRVREVGADGSLSPERALCFHVNCELPRVVAANLDRAAQSLTIDFSRAMDPATLLLGDTITIGSLAGTLGIAGSRATISITDPLADAPVTLVVKKSVKDLAGASMAADYTQTFTAGDANAQGRGVVSGAVYDATNGRALANAAVVIGGMTTATNDRGRYSLATGEGAFTIEARANGYTTAWRQILVPAGSGVVPIDIRLTKRGAAQAGGSATTLTHGGDTAVTTRASLTLGTASLAPDHNVRLTALGAQALPGLLPLGWSPLAAAEIVVDDATTSTPLPGAKLHFDVEADRALSLVRYDEERDEWRVVVASASAGDAFDLFESGSYALVYPDAAPHLAHPPAAVTGHALRGVDACADCTLTSRSFTLEPRQILPNGRAVATLVTEGSTQTYPSGTALQATIDEQLNLADGRVLVDPPFATDLLVYRTLQGDTAEASFHLAPTARAAAVTLRDGVEHIRITDYPGRIDRGALLGSEGGRVPGDGGITIDVPPNATADALHATASSIDAADLPAVRGFRVAGGFSLTLTRATETAPADGVTATAPSLAIPARATFPLAGAGNAQVIVGEVLPSTPFGVLVRLVAIAEPASNGLYATRAIDSTELPLDGIVRDGRYVILVADAPVAFAFGTVRNTSDVALDGARVSANDLGVTALTNVSGVFAIPVLAQPAAPFALTARTLALGDGTPLTAPASPQAGAFVDAGVLRLVPRAPELLDVTTTLAPFTVTARFDTAIDPASAANGIRVVNVTTATAVGGTITAAGNLVTFAGSEPLRAASQYAITIAPTIRSASGTPFGQTVVRSIHTDAIPDGGTSIHPDKISITLPDANGKVTIRGSAGALPPGAKALAVRRGVAFRVQYQALVGSDGAFSFAAGDEDPRDRIATTDVIDLQVIDRVSSAIIAIIELTPFVSEDGRTFLAPVNRSTHFVSADGIGVTVPDGAFDEPTFITVKPSAKTALDGVPNFDAELVYATSVELDFEGVAKKRLDVELPIATSTDTSRNWLLGELGQSTRGPRLMIVDTLRVAGNRLVTGFDATSSARRVATNSTLTGAELSKTLIGINRKAVFAAVDIRVPSGDSISWGVIDGLQSGYDLFWDSLQSLYASHFYLAEAHGRIAIPVLTNRQFEVVGVDAGTGLEAFSKVYDPLPFGDPGASVDLANPNPDLQGPYPLFATPFRIETIDIDVKDVVYTSVRDFTVMLHNGIITANTTLPNDVSVTLMNVTNGSVDRTRAGGLAVSGDVGDRVVLLVEERDVDPYTPISITFNEPLDLPADPSAWFAVETAPANSDAFVPITGALDVHADSGGRRVVIALPASLTRGNRYRVAIKPGVIDRAGQHLGAPGATLAEPLYLQLRVREPGDRRTSFDLSAGAIRDEALNGNVLFVSALDGGLSAFDVADPAGMTASSAPIAKTKATDDTAYWAIASDHHGRVWTTGIKGMFGVVRSFRLEDFLAKPVDGVEPRATGITSWAPGSASALGLASGLVMSDRVEATPRKLQILLQDDPIDYDDRAGFIAGTSATTTRTVGDDFAVLSATFARNPQLKYSTQRVTVENLTLDLRWSADATQTSPAHIDGIVARAGDRLRVIRNRMTYGVVSLFGYGVGVFDLNAIESNDAADKPLLYEPVAEQIRVTNGTNGYEIGEAIPALTYTPDAAILTRPGSSDLQIYALDANRGVLDLAITPPSDGDSPVLSTAPLDRAPIGFVFENDPRIAKLRALYVEHKGEEPYGHFTGASVYHWTREAQDNARGERGSEPGTRVERDYILVPGYQYGLLVLEAPDAGWLGARHFVDDIWIPGGAVAVRVIPRTNLATVVDGNGYVLLVDLSRLDERAGIDADALFPTAAAVLAHDVDTPDPRIVWKSSTPLMLMAGSDHVVGTLAPVADSDTGFVYAGKLTEKTTHVIAALDPRIRVQADTGASNGLSEIGGIVPLGIEPPKNVLHDSPNASLAAFRLAVSLPGALADSLGGTFPIDIESERVAGAVTEDMPSGYPRAHRRGTSMRRVLPDQLAAQLRHQKGFNQFISPWIVAIADPRASETYTWPNGADRAAAGCSPCQRPEHLRGDNAALELFTNGRLVAVHPHLESFSGTGWDYLAGGKRLETRFATIMADTVRAPDVRVPAQNPAIAGGMLQETTYLHSGEVETSSVDLDAGGRAGWNVAFDRTYRSRTIGGTALGQGWESLMFRRLRALPSGDVEYRDGAGEIWLFKQTGSGYERPKGLFLNLSRNDRGWLLTDQQYRITAFDNLGRLIHETDEFADSAYTTSSGNVIRYLYDRSGRLAEIIDPVGRSSKLTYAADGHLQSVEDWRGRRVAYGVDGLQRLTSVELPRVNGTTPAITYAYESAGGVNDLLEVAPNLHSITDPIGGSPRVTFTYAADQVRSQSWATGESATFAYGHGTATTTDALQQVRKYALTDKRIASLDEVNVETSTTAFGTLPSSLSASAPPRGLLTRSFAFGYDGEGLVTSSALAGVRTTTNTWRSVEPAVPGFVLASSTTGSITRTYDYDGALLKRASANGIAVNYAPLDARRRTSSAANDITETVNVDTGGLTRSIQTAGGNDGSGAGSNVTLDYESASAAQHARSLLKSIDRGGLVSRFEYPSPTRTVATDSRGVATTTDVDEWLRPRHVVTTGPSLTLDSTTDYDANGRVTATHRTQQGRVVSETYTYDALGRVKTSASDNVDVAGSLASIETRVDYDLPNRTVRRTIPSGAVITETLDGLGRVKTRRTTTGGTDIVEELVYDLDGNVVFSADNHVAAAFAYDQHGCAIATLRPDGTKSTATCDAWGRATELRELDAAGGVIAETKPSYTAAGRVESVATKVDETQTRVTETRWDGGGRATRVASNDRASHATFDSAGRLLSSLSGEGSLAAITTPFQTFHASAFDGALIARASVAEKGSAPVVANTTYDTLANPTHEQVGSLEWQHAFDEDGNLVSDAQPARPAETFEHDARGSVRVETKPGGATIRHAYDASGSAREYRDPVDEVTGTINDLLGRPLERTYADGTSETFTYDGTRLLSSKDRQGRVSTYVYNAKGQLAQLRANGGDLLEEFEYDAAGRMTHWTTAEGRLVFERFDMQGRPRRTRQIRYRDRSGFGARQVLDEFVQDHEWNVHGERTGWTMPVSSPLDAGWTAHVSETRDAMGNITSMSRTLVGGASSSELLTADYRGASRPNRRTLTTTGAASIDRTYGYDDATAQLIDMTARAREIVVAGTRVSYDGVQIAREVLHGLSGESRANAYTYDGRSRLATSRFAREQNATSATETMTPADFRTALDRPADLPSLSFAEQTGHKIAAMTRGDETRAFSYGGGAERVDDGRFVYEFDARGRLVSATEKPAGSASVLRRIRYEYAASNRMIGRIAEYGREGAWQIEDRADVIEADGVPAQATFVWDPISDTLAEIADARTGKVVQQVIHGGNTYDDPLEIASADASGVHRLYPVFDEAGAGTLQVLINERGEVVSRAFIDGAYGEDEFTLAAPIVDRVEVTAQKNTSGALESVIVSMRVTEALAPSTVATGARLATLDPSGAVVRSTPVVPTLFENHTIRWTLTSTEWTALTAAPSATTLSATPTPTLRAAAWPAETAIAPPPTHPLGAVTAWLTTLPPSTTQTTTLYSVPTLAGAGAPGVRAGVAAYQALPFAEKPTGLVNVRNRWYEPDSGTFLSPDPLGYRDSSNLYAFAGGDPVNNRDPQGEGILGDYLRGMKNAPAAFVGGVKGAVKAGAGGVKAVYDFFYEGVGGVIYEQTGSKTFEAQGRAWQKRRERFQKAVYAGPGASLKAAVDNTTSEFNRRIEVGDVKGSSEILGSVGAMGAAASRALPPGEVGSAPALVTDTGAVVAVPNVSTAALGELLAPIVLATSKDKKSGVPSDDFTPNPEAGSYSRPRAAGPTRAQNDAVQGLPCVDCGAVTPKQRADHIDPLVVQHYREGRVNVEQQSQVDAVQAHCPTCSAIQGGQLSAFARRMRKLLEDVFE